MMTERQLIISQSSFKNVTKVSVMMQDEKTKDGTLALLTTLACELQS
jgi:hypothetical protein